MITQDQLDWMRSRPDSIKELMRRFPPACYVKALVPLSTPAPGIIGQVMTYFEPDETHPLGLVSVQAPDPFFGIDHRAQCRPEWLEVVGYYDNKEFGFIQSHEWIKEILK